MPTKSNDLTKRERDIQCAEKLCKLANEKAALIRENIYLCDAIKNEKNMSMKIMVCGVHCYPGDEKCNNYCNYDKSKLVPYMPSSLTMEDFLLMHLPSGIQRIISDAVSKEREECAKVGAKAVKECIDLSKRDWADGQCVYDAIIGRSNLKD